MLDKRRGQGDTNGNEAGNCWQAGGLLDASACGHGFVPWVSSLRRRKRPALVGHASSLISGKVQEEASPSQDPPVSSESGIA
jgi:hypothetical protein